MNTGVGLSGEASAEVLVNGSGGATPPGGSGMERLLNVAQLAEWLDKSRTWVYTQAALGKLPHTKVGKSLRFLPSEIQKWLINGGTKGED